MDFLKQNSIQSNNSKPNYKVPTGNNGPDTTATFSVLIQAIPLNRQQVMDKLIRVPKNQIPETFLRLRRRVPTKLASTDEYL